MRGLRLHRVVLLRRPRHNDRLQKLHNAVVLLLLRSRHRMLSGSKVREIAAELVHVAASG